MVQQEFVFDDVETKTAPKKGSFLWNSETREFLGRDGGSWAKISFFYAIFYTCLASFFVGMLAVFVHFMPRDVPTYHGASSTMSHHGTNPGLGFRPQVDVEDHVIMYNPFTVDNPTDGYLKYVRNLKNFLDSKYGKVSPDDLSNVIDCKSNKSYVEELKNGKSCEFDQQKLFKETECNEKNSFGYQTHRPCVLIKMNKIISWEPKSSSGLVKIHCEGETSADKDNLKKVTYHSEEALNAKDHGSIDLKFFPYYNQKSYRAPFVWAQFDVAPNTLVNIECKAFADNIDNSDRYNKRGLTKFSLYVAKNTNN